MRPFLAIVATCSVLLGPAGAAAQWSEQTAALRTPGPVVRPGDALRVELIAFEPVYSPFIAQITYRFAERVVVRDEDGVESQSTRARTVVRPPTPAIEALAQGRVLLLDDTFHLGDGSSPGRYDVEVTLVGTAGHTLGTIRTCVEYQPDERGSPSGRAPGPPAGACDLAITGVQRYEGDGVLTLHGRFPDLGVYRALIVDQHAVVGQLDYGVGWASPTTIDVVSPVIDGLGGRSVDLVVHDMRTNRSATLRRLTLPARR